jgi:hypothetical protein
MAKSVCEARLYKGLDVSGMVVSDWLGWGLPPGLSCLSGDEQRQV